MARKRKILPKDFEETLVVGDIAALKAVFDTCELDARGDYYKQVAYAFFRCPDELARWMVAQGADVDAPDRYGCTPLHRRAGYLRDDIAILLDLGADVHGAGCGATALHHAARAQNLAAARQLIARGARVDARDTQGLTPLGAALQVCSNAQLDSMAPMAELLLDAAATEVRPTLLRRLFGSAQRSEAGDPVLKAMVRKLGETFEFFRADFNPDSVDAASAGLDRLYALFSVEPVQRREMHAGDTPIAPGQGSWEERHAQLWQQLVPGRGAAATVQGEVIRISGRVVDELEGNGGINWDDDYRRMLDAAGRYFASGRALPLVELDEAKALIVQLKKQHGNPNRLAEFAVLWVEGNPAPIALGDPDYAR